MNLVGLKTAFSTKETNQSESVETYVVGFNPHGLIDGLTPSGDLALNEMINERLRIYEAQIGYPTDITPNDVKGVLKDSLMALSALLHIKKWNDAKNLVLGNGKKLNIDKGIVLPANGINTASTLINLSVQGVGGAGWGELTSPSITNTVWANLIGNLKEVAVLPPALANLSSYLMSNYFSNHYNDDDGVSQLIEFVPNYANKFEQLLDLFDLSIDGVRTAYSDNPGLYSFMVQFIPNIELVSEDFNRDLSGRSINIVDDTKLLQLFDLDPALYYYGGKDSMLTYGSENIIASIFESEPTQLMDISTVFYELVFKSAGQPSDAILKVMHYVKSDLMTRSWALPEGTLTNASAIPAAQIGQVFSAMEKYPFDSVYRASYTFNDVTKTLVINMPDLNMKKGFNLYMVNGDDVSQVRDTWFKSAILGLELPGTVNRVNNQGLDNESDVTKERKTRRRKKK